MTTNKNVQTTCCDRKEMVQPFSYKIRAEDSVGHSVPNVGARQLHLVKTLI